MKDKPELTVLYDRTHKWHIDGKLHREDGPAVISDNGEKAWYLNGKKIDPLIHMVRTYENQTQTHNSG